MCLRVPKGADICYTWMISPKQTLQQFSAGRRAKRSGGTGLKFIVVFGLQMKLMLVLYEAFLQSWLIQLEVANDFGTNNTAGCCDEKAKRACLSKKSVIVYFDFKP